MKEKATRSLARVGETAAKVYSNIGFCVMLFHEPKMPEVLIKENLKKKHGKNS